MSKKTPEERFKDMAGQRCEKGKHWGHCDELSMLDNWIFNGFYLNENNEPIGAQSKLLPLKWYNGISDDKILWESIAKLVGEKDIDLVKDYAEKYANYLFFDDLWEYLYFKKDSNYKQLAKDRDKKEQEWESELVQQITGDIDIHDEFGNEITGEDHEPYDM